MLSVKWRPLVSAPNVLNKLWTGYDEVKNRNISKRLLLNIMTITSNVANYRKLEEWALPSLLFPIDSPVR